MRVFGIKCKIFDQCETDTIIIEALELLNIMEVINLSDTYFFIPTMETNIGLKSPSKICFSANQID